MQKDFTFRFSGDFETNEKLLPLFSPSPLSNDTPEEDRWRCLFDKNIKFRTDLYSILDSMPHMPSCNALTWDSFKQHFKSKTHGRHIRVSPLNRLALGHFKLTPFVVRITHCHGVEVQTKFLNLSTISSLPTTPQGLWEVRKNDASVPGVAIHNFGPGGPIWFEVSY